MEKGFDRLGAFNGDFLTKRVSDEPQKILPLFADTPELNSIQMATRINLLHSVAMDINEQAGFELYRSFTASAFEKGDAQAKLAQTHFDNLLPVIVGEERQVRELLLTLKKNYGDVGERLEELFEKFLKISKSTDYFCFGATRQGQQSPHTIGSAVVFISSNADIEACLYEELIQVQGLFADFPDGYPSIFNDDNVYRIPSNLDWLLLKIHVQDELRAGMKKRDVQQLLPDVLHKINSSG